MVISWERFGSSHRRADGEDILGIQFRSETHDGWGLGAFTLAREEGADLDEPFAPRARRGKISGPLHGVEPSVLDGSFELIFNSSPQRADLPATTVVMRLISPGEFSAERVGATTIAEHVRELVKKWRASPCVANAAGAGGRADDEPFTLVIMGITDAAPGEADGAKRPGIDQVLSPSLLPQLADQLDIAPPKIALVVTGLERDFARFNPGDPRWLRYASAQRAAWDPVLVRRMLATVVDSRPHLRGLIHNDRAFRGSTGLTVTAAMPCGFLNNGLGCVNYNPWGPGWIVGGPWLEGTLEAEEVVPHHCADALITALTGRTTEFQFTAQNLEDTAPLPIGGAGSRGESHASNR